MRYTNLLQLVRQRHDAIAHNEGESSASHALKWWAEDLDTSLERKAARVLYYQLYVEGWKEADCSACNGSGYYDDNGSPPCGACGGSGRERRCQV